MSQIYTVSEVANTIVRHCSGLFSFVWIEGEVVNCSYSSSGTLYFSLKDDNVLLDCVWFESKQKDIISFDILTGEVYEEPICCVSKRMKNGDYLYVAGSLLIYKERSKYQLYVEVAQYVRQGDYEKKFEDKKRLLEQEGLLNPCYKQKIPKNPYCIALITSKEGAALQDFLYVLSQRGYGGKILLYNTLMQGNCAIEEICHAIVASNESDAEIVVIIRGGGSKEEIDIFNNEQIVRSIFSSQLPVITGIGHEIDETLSDLVADATGITPTFVAHMLFEERALIKEQVSLWIDNLYDAVYDTLYAYERKLSASLISVTMAIQAICIAKEEKLISNIRRQESVLSKQCEKYDKQLDDIIYTYYNIYCYDSLLKKVDKLNSLATYLYKNIYVSYWDKHIFYTMVKKKLESYSFFGILNSRKEQLERLLQKIYGRLESHILLVTHTVTNYSTKLSLVSPEHIMAQGYVCIEDMSGVRITDMSSLKSSSLCLRFRDGIVHVEVVSKGEKL